MSLDQLSDERGRFCVLAVDHRDSLRQFLKPDAPDSVPASTLTSIKDDLVRTLSPAATGVMLEPEYSIPQLIDSGALALGVGFLAALESQGYLADPSAGITTLYWPVAEAAASGASALKLLLPYHPDHELAAGQRAFGAAVIAECAAHGIPLVLEPLFHGLTDRSDRLRVVLETVEHFAGLAPALLKLPFPVDPELVTDTDERIAACREVTQRCQQPWALLSGGGSFELFAEQVAASGQAGAAGFMVGRALWGEAAHAPADERHDIIESIVAPRFAALCEIARSTEPA